MRECIGILAETNHQAGDEKPPADNLLNREPHLTVAHLNNGRGLMIAIALVPETRFADQIRLKLDGTQPLSS